MVRRALRRSPLLGERGHRSVSLVCCQELPCHPKRPNQKGEKNDVYSRSSTRRLKACNEEVGVELTEDCNSSPCRETGLYKVST